MRRSLCLLSLVLALPLQAADKVVNLYSWADYVAPETLQRFERETGYKVRYDTFDTTEVLETKLLTGGSGYDVVVPSSTVLARALKANALQPLDAQAMPGYANLDKDLLAKLAEADPGNRHAVPYTWGTLGLGVNVEAVRQRLGDVPLDSLDLLFKPEYASRLKECGIAMPDSPQEVIGVALNYLGKDPYSQDKADLAAAQNLLSQLQPSISYVANGRQISDLANGSVCLALTYNGDAAMAGQPGHPQGRPAPRGGPRVHRLHAQARVGGGIDQHAVLRQRQPGRHAAGGRSGAQRPGHLPVGRGAPAPVCRPQHGPGRPASAQPPVDRLPHPPVTDNDKGARPWIKPQTTTRP
jgi:putrescine transport system substrate-binding protein